MVSEYEAKIIQQKGAGDISVAVRTDHSEFNLTLRGSDTVRTLKAKIAEKCSRSPQALRVLMSGQELKGDKTLREAKVNNNAQIIVRFKDMDPNKAPSEAERFREYASEVTIRSWLTQIIEMQLQGLGLRGSPVQNLIHTTNTEDHSIQESQNLAVAILAQQNNFQRLFKLLNLQGAIAGRAWDLLNTLPPNSSLIDDFAKVEELDQKLSTYLDPQVILKLAYSLNMISILVGRQNQTKSAQNAWCDQFLQLEGVKRLLDTFLQLDLEQSSAHITCYSKLLELVNFFVEYENSAGLDSPSLKKYDSLLSVGQRILDLLGVTAKANIHVSASNQSLVRCTLSFLAKALPAHNQVGDSLINWPSLDTWLRCVLLESNSRQEREDAEETLSAIAEAYAPFRDRLFSLLLSLLPEIASFSKSSQFFFILLERLYANGAQTGEIGWQTSLGCQLFRFIKDHPVLEVTEAQRYKDTSLVGLLDLTRIVINNSPELKRFAYEEGLLLTLFSECLFDIPTAELHGADAPPKCKSKDSRYAAYRLLVELCREDDRNFELLFTAMMKHIRRVRPKANWQVTPDAKKKAVHGYVGLENMGATCYMNSLLQQLYLMPQFRREILSVRDQSEDLEDSPLYQLQYTFAYLQETLKGSYKPVAFTASYKDWEGNPMNTRIQMDANEFFNTLFDKLEGLLAPTPRPHLLKELYGGVIANQIISQHCDHVSENIEGFYTVGVEIKNKKDIISSLDAYIEGEMLQGDAQYYCEQCDKKVDALKRSCLKSLPPTLLIQLKRFEFDLMEMRNKKLNGE
jgi:hypothetical protein